LPIRVDLPEPWRHRLASLVESQGIPEHPDFLHYHDSCREGIEDRSPKTVDDLRVMSVEEVARFTRIWRSSDETGGPTQEALQHVLMKAAAEEPARFAADIECFRQSPPGYVRTLLYGLREAALAGRPFPWPPVLELCGHLASTNGCPREATADHDPPGDDRSSTRGAVAELLRDALGHDPDPVAIDQRGAVWGVLEALAYAPDPQSEVAPVDPDPRRLEAAPFAQTTRVTTLDAVVSYAIWVVRSLSDSRPGVTAAKVNLDAIPEVKRVLDDHVDPVRHPAVEVRAFFGRVLPRLTALDAGWVEQNLSRVFPADDGSAHLHEAAWRGYILWWQRPSQRLFRLLRDHYGKAVERIQPTGGRDRGHDPDQWLARHLMIVYWYGEVAADTEDSPVTRFFSKAPDELRAEAVHFLGRILGEEESIPADVMDRLKRLWQLRRQAAAGQPDHARELTAFGGWVASGKFDQGWALAQLNAILETAGTAEPEREVVEWLAKTAPRFAAEAVECLGRMAEGFEWDHRVAGWAEQAGDVLDAALRSPRPEARRAAADLINRFGTRGHHQFRHLLRGPSGGPAT
jgi:hypothetical protein